MNFIIDSNLIKLEITGAIPWNHRLIEPQGVAASESICNEVSLDYIDRFKAAIDENEISFKERTACPCGSALLETLSIVDRFNLPFTTRICQSCGLVMTSPYMEENSLELYYDKFYHALHFGKESLATQNALFRVGQGSKIYSRIRLLLKTPCRLRVLEIGVGTGNVLSELKAEAAAEGIEVEELGTEYSSECINRAREGGLKVICGGFDEVIELEQRFDLVILSHVFEHFTDLTAVIEKLMTVLDDGGLVYVEVPGLMTLHKKTEYGCDYLRYVTHAHVYHFNLTSLTNIMNKLGFELIAGNEEVEAVFMRGTQRVCNENNYRIITDYLRFAEQNREYFYGNHKMLQLLREKEAQLKEKEAQIQSLHNSLSWKMTLPLRFVAKHIQEGIAHIKKALGVLSCLL